MQNLNYLFTARKKIVHEKRREERSRKRDSNSQNWNYEEIVFFFLTLYIMNLLCENSKNVILYFSHSLSSLYISLPLYLSDSGKQKKREKRETEEKERG